MVDTPRKYSSEEMYLDTEKGAMQRGRRIAPRTETCRPCLVWKSNEPDKKIKCVIMDLNRYGLKIRTFEDLFVGEEVYIQMMKEDTFTTPLGTPIKANIVREAISPYGLKDYGAKRIIEDIKKPEEIKPIKFPSSKSTMRTPPKMHTIDLWNEE
ncbi:MAG: hypothetical protein N3G21_09485 [Candidatus Hydrogenedentes bacterium]|nr:hypothetical protein [Candidatus Hydrogenedentota bacterium]